MFRWIDVARPFDTVLDDLLTRIQRPEHECESLPVIKLMSAIFCETET